MAVEKIYMKGMDWRMKGGRWNVAANPESNKNPAFLLSEKCGIVIKQRYRLI